MTESISNKNDFPKNHKKSMSHVLLFFWNICLVPLMVKKNLKNILQKKKRKQDKKKIEKKKTKNKKQTRKRKKK